MKNLHLFVADTPLHTCQITIDKAPLFYDDVIILSHFTILCTNALRYSIRVYALCYMLTHLHKLCESQSIESLRIFLGNTSSAFAHEYNAWFQREGAVFAPSEEYVPKNSPKAFRSCHNYIANNAPEKKIVERAVQYQWNLLAYSISDRPFSPKRLEHHHNDRLPIYMRLIRRTYEKGKHLSISRLYLFKSNLTAEHWKRLVDYIIGIYNVIDYGASANYFGGLDNMLTAPDSNMGGEFELPDDRDSYSPYYQMLELVKEEMPLSEWNPYRLSDKQVRRWILKINSRVRAGYTYISRFLHVPYDKVKEIIRFPAWY